jgi:hypothetical protein
MPVRTARLRSGEVHYLQSAYDPDIRDLARPGNAVVIGLQDGDAATLAEACEAFADFDLILEWRGRRLALHALGSEGMRELRAALRQTTPGGDA